MLFILAGAIFLAVEDHPRVKRTPTFLSEHIERAKRIFDRNDPRQLKPGEIRTIKVSEEDLDLWLNYLANRFAKGGSHVELHTGIAHVILSAELPRNVFGRFVNVDAELRANDSMPQFERLHIGPVPLPAWLANGLLEYAMSRLEASKEYRFAVNMVKSVGISGDAVSITYQWTGLPERARKGMLSPEDTERVRNYQQRMANAARHAIATGPLSLTTLMPPMFQLAEERSQGGDSVAENRALILVLTFYVNGHGLDAILPAAKDWAHPVQRTLTLNGRDDFAKHFMVSAALAAFAGEPLADAIGLYKEVDDARVGSGFSFNDIAADRAGSRFGELATANSMSARKLQEQMKRPLEESVVMPSTDDLPEFMSEAEFSRRFGGVGSPAYRRMMEEIERRIAALPFNR